MAYVVKKPVSILEAWGVRLSNSIRMCVIGYGGAFVASTTRKDPDYLCKKIRHYMLHPFNCATAGCYQQLATRVACLARTRHSWVYSEHQYRDCPWHFRKQKKKKKIHYWEV